jgi:deoxyribodipyrimidine photo-lyase
MQKAICWFRQDLRLYDNPALMEASDYAEVLPIYIIDSQTPKQHQIGSASKWWLHNSLISLNKSLNNNLSIYHGDPFAIIKNLINYYNIDAIFWNRCYEPFAIQRDKEIKEYLQANNIKNKSFNASLLWEPWEIKKTDGSEYKVFTPYYRKGCLLATSPAKPIDKPNNLALIKDNSSLSISQLNLLPETKWYMSLEKCWSIGEEAAKESLYKFIENGLDNYKIGRDFPATSYVSRLSPHIHFGEISIRQIWHTIAAIDNDNSNIDHFLSELGWREFSYYQLYHHPTLPEQNLQRKFDKFAWQINDKNLKAWQTGNTGIPLVDAGMRELWQTGYMHNRIRMVVGSFLVKNLRLHWKHGEQWFWDTLVDADLASNCASWQWVAGCGNDAAPYFRIFNPITQGEKFDPNGEYIRKYIPELAKLPTKYIYAPWQAPEQVLEQANITLGTDYPLPIIDLKLSREQALLAFQALKTNKDE